MALLKLIFILLSPVVCTFQLVFRFSPKFKSINGKKILEPNTIDFIPLIFDSNLQHFFSARFSKTSFLYPLKTRSLEPGNYFSTKNRKKQEESNRKPQQRVNDENSTEFDTGEKNLNVKLFSFYLENSRVKRQQGEKKDVKTLFSTSPHLVFLFLFTCFRLFHLFISCVHKNFFFSIRRCEFHEEK